MKKLFFVGIIFLLFTVLPINIRASDLAQARIGNRYFDSLEDAIAAASSTDIINLTSNVTLNEPLNINKTVNINLNGKTIQADEKVFVVHGGSLNLSGNGLIKESKPNYGAIVIQGSEDSNKKDFSTISVGSGITLEGWSGIFINHYNKTGYGILVNMNGSINAVNDVDGGSGTGIYVNGNIQHENNSPIINLSDTAKITSTGNGIYAAGYATYNINGAYIEGKESGLGIKAGVFNILDGSIIGSGEDKTPTSGNNNGIRPTGVAIQIESNPGYAGNIELYIKDGTFNSKNSNVVYEYTTNNTTEVKNLNISGGSFTSNGGKDVFLLSNSLKSIHPKFISGGSYSSDPTKYLKSGYSVQKNENSLYEVISSTIQVFGSNSQSNSSGLSTIIVISSLLIIGFVVYLNRNNIGNFISSIINKLN